jgi:alkylation response protein AidB-like acyl-CoA dehydrogenase
MRREARLATGPRWLASYGGKHVVKGYARWYSVDLFCAIKELRLLGVPVPHEYEAQVRGTLEQRAVRRRVERAAVETAVADQEADDPFLLELAGELGGDWFTLDVVPSRRRADAP